MDVANRLLNDIHRRFFLGRRDLWLSVILLALTSIAGATFAINALHDDRNGLPILSVATVASGILTAALTLMSRRLDSRAADERLCPIRTSRAIAGCRFAGHNLILVTAVLAGACSLLLMFGSSFLALVSVAAAVATSGILLLGTVPVPPLNSLVLSTGPVSRRNRSVEDWPADVILFERQRRARQDDSASERPRLEEIRDALDAARARLDPRDVRPHPPGTPVEELSRRMHALVWPGGVSAVVAALTLLLLAPGEWLFADSADMADVPQNPTQTSSSDSTPASDSGSSGAPRRSDSSQTSGGKNSGSQKSNGRPSNNGSSGSANSEPQRGSSSGSGSVTSSAKPNHGPREDPEGSSKTSARHQSGSSSPPVSPKRQPKTSGAGGSGGAGASGEANAKRKSKPGTQPKPPASPPPPPGQGPITPISISGGTQVDGQPVQVPAGSGTGSPADSDAVRRASAPESARSPQRSQPLQIPAIPLQSTK